MNDFHTNISELPESTIRELLVIKEKVFDNQRITPNEGILLLENADLGFLGQLASYANFQKNGNKVYYNKNIHIEPTNICIFNCAFCSYVKKKDEQGWELSIEEIIQKIENQANKQITEVHIVGGVHPDWDIHFYANLMNTIKKNFPLMHIKAFTAVELHYFIKRAGMEYKEGLQYLKDNGLDSIPGGGAEIFDEKIRDKICPKKPSGEIWLKVHEAAHSIGVPTNATILYGHLENYSHRIDHLDKLRNLQDKTKGFNAFIPLKYKNKNNEMSGIKEVSVIEDLKNYAISRIFLDNFQHIKAYWPMIGKDLAQISLSFGVDDLDGTINDSTKIYSRAGAEDKPSMTVEEIKNLILECKKEPVERDSLYQPVEDIIG